MSKRSRKPRPIVRRLNHLCGLVALVLHWLAAHLPRPRRIPIEIVLADQSRRRGLKRTLRRSVGQLRKVLGDLLPQDVVVVVQQVIPAEHELAGCCQLGQRPDGQRFALIRLALQIKGRRLSTDEVIAALAEQCIGLAMNQAEGIKVRVPVQLEPAAWEERRTPLPPDPLKPDDSGPFPRAA